ncbi:MAG: T9SS type A sorting domain-containing protein, partial [Saprospiraceae bacterium]
PLFTDLTGLEQITSLGGTLDLGDLPQVASFSSLENITSVGGRLILENNPALNSLEGLKNIVSVGADEILISNLPSITSLLPLGGLVANCQKLTVAHMAQLTSLDGLENVSVTQGRLIIRSNPVLTSISSLAKVTTLLGLDIFDNAALTGLEGLENLVAPMSNIDIRLSNNAQLSSLNALKNLVTPYVVLTVDHNPALADLQGLEKITGGYFDISDNPGLTSLSGLENVTAAWFLKISNNAALTTLSALVKLQSGYFLRIVNNPALTSLSGLEHLAFDGSLIRIEGNSALSDLTGLDSVVTVVDSLIIINNGALKNLDALGRITEVGNVQIQHNPALSDCAIFAVCNHLLNMPNSIEVSDNAPGCNTPAEVAVSCNSKPVVVRVGWLDNGNFQPIPNLEVSLTGDAQMNLRPTDATGTTEFGFLENGNFTLALPEVSDSEWQISEQRVLLTSINGLDSTHVTLTLSPFSQCPELTVTLGLPSFFRGCLVNSTAAVKVANTGTNRAEGVRTAVVMPPTLQLLTATPAPAAQNGDTLFFELGDVPPFAATTLQLTVKTDCNVFLIGQTLCLEAFAGLQNPCSITPVAFSEIKLAAACVGDTLVRFTLKNIGDAPTQALHSYQIIRNETVLSTVDFSLNAQQSLSVELPADGATYRMEATKWDDGSLTATALENCGGLTPGLITAFWLDHGPPAYDFDCRQVIGSFDPNLKSAVPTGAGWQHLIVANRPLLYTIDFQNTGTDTAFRVLLRDALPLNLDVSTFRPGAASHPYTWEIKGHSLEVLFLPIMLPDSLANEPASHGFFSFQIEQKPELPDGSTFNNTAAIIFDFNPPIVTNTVQHTIGRLTVQVDEPQAYARLWQVLGNPTRDLATFRTTAFIAGEKRFDLYDLSGQRVRSMQFAGQAFEFRRDGLNSGLYFFKIGDAQGRVFAGKIVVAE